MSELTDLAVAYGEVVRERDELRDRLDQAEIRLINARSIACQLIQYAPIPGDPVSAKAVDALNEIGKELLSTLNRSADSSET
ncbi:hypothetical protein [Prescottella equi]|uniref:hypothetical protein n=1 Tax=Rhodococcus hoagii TaxID=43767 RepID=UPI001EEBA3EF|nr:hypothetical protein [Prescottella equi]